MSSILFFVCFYFYFLAIFTKKKGTLDYLIIVNDNFFLL